MFYYEGAFFIWFNGDFKELNKDLWIMEKEWL